MDDSITWPPAFNVIRRNSTHNTFGVVRNPKSGAPRPHQGWDFTAPLSTPVFSIDAGTVEGISDRGDHDRQLKSSYKVYMNDARLLCPWRPMVLDYRNLD